MSDLVVELYGSTIGWLTGRGPTFDFVTSPDAIDEFGLDSLVLSVAVPFAAVPARGGRARRQNFFRELLPEGQMLVRLAQQAGVPLYDVVGMLRAYGRDVAGALQIRDPEAPGEPRTPALEPLSQVEVGALLTDVASYPLANKPPTGASTLAGVQDKILLVRTAEGWARALDGYPSTHILKPVSRDHPTIIYDEEYGARLARALGLTSFATTITEFDGVPALVVERYDREVAADGPPRRIHQEDLNQALGLQGDQKYQRYGGKASLARVAHQLTVLGDRAAVRRLARMTVLAVATGNLDMHAKNLALVHRRDGTVDLAPAYDVVPQTHLPNDGELALAVDRTYRHAAVTRANLAAEIGAWGVRDADDLVEATLDEMRDAVAREAPHPRAHPALRDDIARFVSNLLEGHEAGRG
ncbi:type II toxin-antitoxin system HipA family toxin [Cellulomonas sp. SLBN-39]|uniref:type II toxin-antitoxin system HipA family toxin n=1 Tax=Cellulomonas sp. SLBN-39 TaxID=2768446 RepID=UPI0011520086|nr:HipA domain-containing protein [Cellulomonas sp. SLBN-39]TQL02274.1 serine/threonine-protein kinase HipA [Cellulomonas sp. SLBN-39]